MANDHALLSIARMNEKGYQGTGIVEGIALKEPKKFSSATI
jgi:hypothetical protein